MSVFSLEAPNYHHEFEHNALGQLLLDFSLIETASDILRPHDFTDEKARHVYQAMLDARRDGYKYIDFIGVKTYLMKAGSLDLIGDEFVEMLDTRVASTHDFETHLARIRRNARRNSIKNTIRKYAHQGISQECDPDAMIEEIVNAFTQISQGDFNELKSAHDREMPQIEQLARDAINGVFDRGISSGLKSLDKVITGFQEKKLYIIAGRPSMGKSALGAHMALMAAMNQKKVLFASMEMPSKDIVMRMLANCADLCRNQIRSGLSEEEIGRLIAAKHEEWSKNIFILDSENTVSSIRRFARRMSALREHGLDMIVVDYLQLLKGDSNSQSRVYEVEEISRRLKEIAREFSVPVIALSQINREAERREGHKPLLSDLRDSGSIEQDADVVMLLFRGDYYRHDDDHDGMIEVNIAKNREGPTGRCNLKVDLRFNRFTDPLL